MTNSGLTDSTKWTLDDVKRNTVACSNALLDTLDQARFALEREDYSRAAIKFEQVVTGLTLLCKVDPKQYGRPLYANQYALAQIYLFGLRNASKGATLLKAACVQAKACGASRDYTTMSAVLATLQSDGISGVLDSFEIAFPEDILY